ncbi:MAG: hypothetical protein J0L63_07730 [Anaerolineae bacterium]|nr:hypothetical protein [Anaerolineae bacterium]MBN8618780.1 hypothetical protein [Anaerolineae bacterium]
MLDELRHSAEDDNLEFDDANFEIAEDTEQKVEKLFLGMTAVERMFISIFLFMNVTILGLAFLLATRRIVF